MERPHRHAEGTEEYGLLCLCRYTLQYTCYSDLCNANDTISNNTKLTRNFHSTDPILPPIPNPDSTSISSTVWRHLPTQHSDSPSETKRAPTPLPPPSSLPLSNPSHPCLPRTCQGLSMTSASLSICHPLPQTCIGRIGHRRAYDTLYRHSGSLWLVDRFQSPSASYRGIGG